MLTDKDIYIAEIPGIRALAGCYKIGMSSAPNLRMKELCGQLPFTARLLATFPPEAHGRIIRDSDILHVFEEQGKRLEGCEFVAVDNFLDVVGTIIACLDFPCRESVWLYRKLSYSEWMEVESYAVATQILHNLWR